MVLDLPLKDQGYQSRYAIAYNQQNARIIQQVKLHLDLSFSSFLFLFHIPATVISFFYLYSFIFKYVDS